AQTVPMGKGEYTLGMAGGIPRMGFGTAPKAALAERFVPYVAVADVDATVKAARKARAKVVLKPTDIPNVGRVAVLTDPQGAPFGVMTLAGQAAAEPADPAAAPGG